jgi:hypothetical protein
VIHKIKKRMIYFIFFMSVWAVYFKKELTEIIVEFHKFLEFIHNENPLLLTYYEEDDNASEEEDNEEHPQSTQVVVEPYENKYMTKFKQFTSDYAFTWADLKFKQEMLVEIPNKIKTETIPYITKQIEIKKDFIKSKVNELIKLLEDHNERDSDTDTDTDDEDSQLRKELTEYYETYGLDGLLEKYGTPVKSTFNVNKKNNNETEFYIIIRNSKEELSKLNAQLDEYHEKIRLNQFDNQAYQLMIDKKLNNLMNNYIIEYTPLGNVVMRYNHNDQTFDYFSNNSIPYRYLETIGRKYVLTYQCKNIFIDMDTEVEHANKLNEENKNKSSSHKIIQLNNKNNKNQLNINNKNSSNTKNKSLPENRNNSTTIVNPINNIDIVVKNSNRYTWKGRFADFKIVKSVKKEIVNKNLKVSFKEFKHMNCQ